MFRRRKKVYLTVNDAELRLLRQSLLHWRNQLLRQGRHTDPIDDMLLKLLCG